MCLEEGWRARLKVFGLPLSVSGPDLVAALGDFVGSEVKPRTDECRFIASEFAVLLGAGSSSLPLQVFIRHSGGVSLATISFVWWVDTDGFFSPAVRSGGRTMLSEGLTGDEVLQTGMEGSREVVIHEGETGAILGMSRAKILPVNGGTDLVEDCLASGEAREDEVVRLGQEVCPGRVCGGGSFIQNLSFEVANSVIDLSVLPDLVGLEEQSITLDVGKLSLDPTCILAVGPTTVLGERNENGGVSIFLSPRSKFQDTDWVVLVIFHSETHCFEIRTEMAAREDSVVFFFDK